MLPPNLVSRALKYVFVNNYMDIDKYINILSIKKDYNNYIENLAIKYAPHLVLPKYTRKGDKNKIIELINKKKSLIYDYFVIIFNGAGGPGDIKELINILNDDFYKYIDDIIDYMRGDYDSYVVFEDKNQQEIYNLISEYCYNRS